LIDGAHGADGRTLVQFDLFEGSESGEIVFVTKSEFDGGNFFGIAMGKPNWVRIFKRPLLRCTRVTNSQAE